MQEFHLSCRGTAKTEGLCTSAAEESDSGDGFLAGHGCTGMLHDSKPCLCRGTRRIGVRYDRVRREFIHGVAPGLDLRR